MSTRTEYVPRLQSYVSIDRDELGNHLACLLYREGLEDIFGMGDTAEEALGDLETTLDEMREHLTAEESRLHPRLEAQLAALRKLTRAA